MADESVRLDDGLEGRVAVHRAIILNICTFTDDDPPEIAAQRRMRRDIGAWSDDHVADQPGGRMDEGGGMDNGGYALDAVDLGHGRTDRKSTRLNSSHKS